MDESSFGIPGNGQFSNEQCRRSGANPPKNESGRDFTSFSSAEMCKDVSSRNGFCIAAAILSQSEVGMRGKSIAHMRWCSDSRVAAVFPHRGSRFDVENGCVASLITTGNTGQTSSISNTGLVPVYSSRRFR